MRKLTAQVIGLPLSQCGANRCNERRSNDAPTIVERYSKIGQRHPADLPGGLLAVCEVHCTLPIVYPVSIAQRIVKKSN